MNYFVKFKIHLNNYNVKAIVYNKNSKLKSNKYINISFVFYSYIYKTNLLDKYS